MRTKQKHVKLSIEELESRTLLATDLTAALTSVLATRSIDGSGNNLLHPTWGSAGTDLLRTAPAAYADGLSAPAGANRPSAREISNVIADQGDADIINDRNLSAMIYVWGQFIDHDLDLTTGASPAQPFNVAVPTGDPQFDPNGIGTQTIKLNRSKFDPATGTTNARQQVNTITSWMDGSMVYGSDTATAKALRTLQGGKLKTSAGDMLPYNNTDYLPGGALPMANDSRIVPDSQLFAAGDVRANENIELTAMQTLFVREHNYWAGKIAAGDPTLNDEQVYQKARAIVIAEIQSITYNQWLPALLGQGALDRYAGYNAKVNPGIANEFSAAAFRVGHTMLGNDVEFLDNQGNEVADGIPLSQAFFNPPELTANGIDPVLKYLASDPASEIDNTIVNSVRNFLFGPPGAGGLDLASLNIQRGRDHGLADYNSVRQAYGLAKVTDFSQITSDPEVQAQLKQLYGSVNNIDLWVGALAEDHVRGASVGPTLKAIISDQFERLRDGDRYWYERTFSGTTLDKLEHTTLTDIIRRNTDLTNLQSNAFFFSAAVTGNVYADLDRDGRIDRGEPGLAGRTVQLIDADEGDVIATDKTDSHGNYRFDVQDGLRTGQYQVAVVMADGSTQPSRTFAITRGGLLFTGVNIGVMRSVRTNATQLTSTSAPTAAADQVDSQSVANALLLAMRTDNTSDATLGNNTTTSSGRGMNLNLAALENFFRSA
ncbi:MAG: peroxidase [Planctomycetia bacterium]|nr:peroxidase [Planctomycetia bacterium]